MRIKGTGRYSALILVILTAAMALGGNAFAQGRLAPLKPVDATLMRYRPAAPAGFAAQHVGGGTVVLRWQATPGAVQYRVDGSGVPAGGQVLPGTTTTISNVPGGPGSWTVVAVYPNDVINPQLVSNAAAMVRFVPRRSQPWLSKNNGPGHPAATWQHYAQICTPNYGFPDCFRSFGPLLQRTNTFMNLWGDPVGAAAKDEAVYGNTNDLGYGRRTKCFQEVRGPPKPGWVTLCYATNHGPGPGEPGYADPHVITRAAAGENPAPNGSYRNPWGGMPRTVSVILKDGQGTVFMSMTPGAFDLNSDLFRREWISWNPWPVLPEPVPATALDSEGPKLAPQACLACHGGRWDPGTGRVQGASLLPVDPGSLAFGSTYPGDRTRYERPYQEENVRRINQIIVGSGSSPAVVEYIRGLYNGQVAQPGATAQADYVPAGWAQQQGLYRSVVKPYCASCHLAGPANLSFATWGNFLQNKALIYASVCQQKSMPHAEIPFRAFWAKDTGPIYLPGLLALSLGYPSCP